MPFKLRTTERHDDVSRMIQETLTLTPQPAAYMYAHDVLHSSSRDLFLLLLLLLLLLLMVKTSLLCVSRITDKNAEVGAVREDCDG